MVRGTGRRAAGDARQGKRADGTDDTTQPTERHDMEQTPTDTIATTDTVTVQLRKPRTVMFNRGTVRHVALHRPSPIRYADTYRTLCGINLNDRDTRTVDYDRKTYAFPICGTCARARQVHDLDLIMPARDELAVKRAANLTAPLVQIAASVYRVRGSTNSYTVTIPHDEHLATLCNCMAGKVHPEKQCKHQVKVLDAVGGRDALVAGNGLMAWKVGG